MFDKPQVVAHESSDGKDRVTVWSSGSAAAVGMTNTNAPPNFCVLGAAFARTGTTSTGVSVVLPGGKSGDVSTSGSAGALLIKNEGQTATYLDTGLFHLCMLYAQGLITDQQDRTDLVKSLLLASGDVARSATQFATVAALQPSAPAAAAAAAPPPKAAAPDSAASAPSTTKSESKPTDGVLLRQQIDILGRPEKPTAEESRQAAEQAREKQNAARRSQSARPASPARTASSPN